MTGPRRELAFAAAAGFGSLVGAVLFLRLWRADLGVPLEYFGDANLQHLLVKTVTENTWFYENPRLGAPHGLELYDYPVLSGDTLNVLVVWVLGVVGFGSAAAMNLLYFLTYPAVGVVGYLVLRRLGAQPGPSFVCAVLYALAPYHFIRGETHLFLAAYYAVPVGAYLALAILAGEELLGRWRATLVTAALAAFVAVASGSFYYSAFTLILVVVAALVRILVARNWRPLLAGGLIAGVLLAVSLVQLAPTLIYRLEHGRNPEVAHRFTFESEVYGLKLTQLVLPLDAHRIGPLARVKKEYTDRFPPGDARGATLGFVATVGLGWLFAVAIAALVGRRPRGLHPQLALLALVSFLFATTGGLGPLLGIVWSQTRAWNRLSIFIAFFALAAVALGLGALRGRLPRPAYVTVLAAVLVIGVLDQTTNAFIPNYPAFKGEWANDGTFVTSVERRLGADSMVAQLPYEPFPEPAAGRQAIYEPAKPYLHSHDVRWSYGAMRGRPGDWGATVAGKPAAEVVGAARASGFVGLVVDRLGYDDNGAAAEADFTKALGAPLRSPNGRWLFWSL